MIIYYIKIAEHDIILKGDAMIKKKNSISVNYFRIILLQFIIVISAFFMTGCYTDKKVSPAEVDMVVVFKIDVPIEKASSILFEKEYIFHEGMDSSKGKQYFLKTGPKFIVKVPDHKIEAFHYEMKNIPQIYEIYQADYTVSKD